MGDLGDPYGSLVLLKKRLGINDGDDDSALDSALNAASRGIDGYCRRQFNKADSPTARRFHPTNRALAIVDDFLTKVGLVVKVDADDDGIYETTLAVTDYEVEPLNGIVDGESGWPFWKVRLVTGTSFPKQVRPAVEVTAQWGWNAVPAPVNEAALIVAEEIFKLKDAPFGVAGFSQWGPMRVRNNPMAKSMLTPYRRRAIRVAG